MVLLDFQKLKELLISNRGLPSLHYTIVIAY
jgi:hypothetical protein